MNPHPIPRLLLLLLLPLYLAPIDSTSPDEFYNTCSSSYTCGKTITGIGYPFRDIEDPQYCSHPGFVLTCNNETNATNIDMLGANFRVLEIDPSTQTMRVAREDVVVDGMTNCPTEMVNTTLDFSIFDYAGAYRNYTFFYGCPDLNFLNWKKISCGNGDDAYILPGEYGPINCSASVVVPGPANGGIKDGGPVNGTELGGILREGFLIRWKIGSQACSACTASKGQCGYMNQTTCFCPTPPYVSEACPMGIGTSPVLPQTPSLKPNTVNAAAASNGHSNTGRNIALYIAGAVFGGLVLGWLIFSSLQQRKKLRGLGNSSSSIQMIVKDIPPPPSPPNKGLKLSLPPNTFTQFVPLNLLSNSDLGKEMSCFGVQVFTYDELQEATSNFDPSRELGNGGFGTVYYGVLGDGRTVAVKRLYEYCFNRVEQFMNEVEILTRLRHKNLVSLYGCTSRHSRELLLVYEFVSNGTVADHLHGRCAKSNLLSWPIRLNIAVETANALAYLHNSDIIHRDVKTTNILLDNNFHVKVADFGLSRLFPNDVSHVSTAPQGTPGYVDPEYYQCYQLTEKSDVYSFGVVLVELISSLQAVDTNRHRHDINLYNMAINKIQNSRLHELVDLGLGFETNSVVRRSITLVAELAFRCLQQVKDMRPTMQEVVEILRGIQDGESNVDKAEIVDIVMDEDVGLLKAPPSPDSDVSHSTV